VNRLCSRKKSPSINIKPVLVLFKSSKNKIQIFLFFFPPAPLPAFKFSNE
jgi:hypothetical protein